MKKNFFVILACLVCIFLAATSCADKGNDIEADDSVVVENEIDNVVDNGDATVENNDETMTENVVKEEEAETAEPEEETPVLDENIALNPEKEEDVVNNLGFENLKLLSGIANALGKPTSEMTEEDILSVKYLAIGPEPTGDYTVYVGLLDYAAAYANEMLKEEPSYDILNELVKMSIVDFDAEKDSFADLGKFKNIEIFEYYDIPIKDISFIKNCPLLSYAYFGNNGITDVSSLAGYDTEELCELDLTNNPVEDWSYLEHIKDKVIVHYETQVAFDENGEQIFVPIVIKLSDKLEQDADKDSETNEHIFSAEGFDELFDE